MDSSLHNAIVDQIRSAANIAGRWTFTEVHGGSINEVYKIQNERGEKLLCKVNSKQQLPGMFEKEQAGLSLLKNNSHFRVPETVTVFTINQSQVLVMEYIEEGARTDRFWDYFGSTLAHMHGQHAEQFGLQTDNYMGALPQRNTLNDKWTTFFIQHRLDLQRRLAEAFKRLPPGASAMIDTVCAKLDRVFNEDQLPALQHGDLWSGNFLCDSNHRPVLIDPACYYGHPAVDLGLTTLFGGYDRKFYEAYKSVRKLPDNWHLQWQVCNLYPILIHVNLFGGNYGQMLIQTLREITRSL